MDFPQGKVSFQGIPDSIVVGGEMTYSRGITPSVCLLHMDAQPQYISEVGALQITYGDVRIVFPDCAVNTHSLRIMKDQRRKPWRWSVQIMDRRWRWKYGSISGEYNVRMPDDTVRAASSGSELYFAADSSTKKSLRDLVELCLQAMGETGYDVTALPTSVYPYVNWQAMNPASEMQNLCDMVSCVPVYDYDTDAVRICKLGDGDQLPERQDAVNPKMPVKAARRPDYLLLEPSATRFQLQFELEAVGLDSDYKSIKPINQLSYAPRSWNAEWFGAFPGVDASERWAAFNTVFRWFRIKGLASGGLDVPGVSDRISSVDQFYCDEHLVFVTKDQDEMPQTVPSIMQGEFWPMCWWIANTDDEAVHTGKFRLLPDRKNIVEFEYPVVALDESSGAYKAPKLLWTTSCRIRRENGDGFVRAPLRYDMPWRHVGAGPRILRHPELWMYVKVNGPGDRDNTSAYQSEAMTYLGQVAMEYAASPPEDVLYSSIVAVRLDGAIAQIRWVAGQYEVSKTRASRNHEFDVFTHSYEWRRRHEKTDSLSDRNLL